MVVGLKSSITPNQNPSHPALEQEHLVHEQRNSPPDQIRVPTAAVAPAGRERGAAGSGATAAPPGKDISVSSTQPEEIGFVQEPLQGCYTRGEEGAGEKRETFNDVNSAKNKVEIIYPFMH